MGKKAASGALSAFLCVSPKLFTLSFARYKSRHKLKEKPQ